ncbi:MAG TPA: isoleucine--tRNA ligase [Acidimicrobiales bacterium]|nr:isoleucine--tRNA ligase [Acidimicrobiales bacterium]
MFRPVSPDPDLVSVETDVLARWAQHRVFERSVEQRAGAEPWVFYEGPPTANNKPGLHHVWARVYKDLFCRYQTMRGRLVVRRAGWDTHGLPVEVEVEKRLGISGKRAIEDKIGVARFVELCRESVEAYVQEFEELTRRIGYWVDVDAAYRTYAPDYVDSVWWHLQTIFDKGLLYEDLKVLPYCPRCETPLSSHELGQPDVYTEEADLSPYVRFWLEDGDVAAPAGADALLVWTTTPWTLLSNVGVAVNPALSYAVVGGTIVAAELVESVFGEGTAPDRTVPGSALVGLRYRRPFDDVEVADGEAGLVVAADYVTVEEGTGVVHLAPAFGEIDRQVGRQFGLATLNPVGPDGRFTAAVPWLQGQSVRDANEHIVAELERRGAIVKASWYTHSVPHCWRCNAVLLYWGKPSWYVATTRHKDDLLRENAGIDWHPEHIRDGRFGEWLANNVDWALSRDRYWGTPLPVWRCTNDHVTCVGSRAELSELADDAAVAHIDPHRPVIDGVTFACRECGATATRVAPVIDAWFDSGSMPAAQWGYPHVEGSKEAFTFPAEFIAEAIDQTRGWFYSLLAVNTIVFGEAAYRHVLCLGHIVDEDGRKMSKSLGNVIDPWDVLDTRGADALRWWMFSQGSPWTPTRGSLAAIDASMRDTVLTLWNTYSFFMTYAALNAFDPHDGDVPPRPQRAELDRWVLSRVERTTLAVTAALDGYEPLAAATAIATLVDDVSNWYVRRSRRRFWRTDPDAPPSDTLAAHATLLEVLDRVAVLLAPMCPFLADHVYAGLRDAEHGASVHLVDWPATDHAAIDEPLEAQMSAAREVVSLGRAARAEAGVKVRQPLRRALVFLPSGSVRPPAGVVEEELNVDHVEFSTELSDVLTYELHPNFRTLGPRLGDLAPKVRAALATVDTVAAARTLEAGGTLTVRLGEEDVMLSSEDVELRVRAESGYAVSRGGGAVVALDLELDDALRRRGSIRELVRQVQELRKDRGLEVSDHVELWLDGLALDGAERDTVAREVLANAVHAGSGHGDPAVVALGDGLAVSVWLSPADVR